jgi:hypothetical protein
MVCTVDYGYFSYTAQGYGHCLDTWTIVCLTATKFEPFILLLSMLKSRDSSVGIALGYGLDDGGLGFNSRRGWEFFSSRLRPERLWGPPSLLSNRHQGLFLGGKAARAWSWPVASIYYRCQRMRVAILLLPQYAFMVWCPVRKKAQGQLQLLPLPLLSTLNLALANVANIDTFVIYYDLPDARIVL